MAVKYAEAHPFALDSMARIVRGDVPELSLVHKFGAIDNVTTTLTPVCSAGVYQTPTALTSLEMVSSDANDAAAGTGARTVVVQGIGTGYAEISETVTLNGVSAVALSNQFYRVYRMYVATSGTYATSSAGSHVGTITLRVASAGATWATIGLSDSFPTGQTQIGAYTVPEGKTAYVFPRHVTIETSKAVNLYLFQRPSVDTVSAPYEPMRVVSVMRGLEQSVDFGDSFPPYGPFVGPCDVGYMAAATATTADVAVDFDIILEDT